MRACSVRAHGRAGGRATAAPGEGDVTTELAEARSLLSRAASVVVFTGAGISAESGVPTFRGPGGLWKQFRPEDLATPEAFARDPRTVWEWYAWRRSVVAACAPNAAHLALGAWVRADDRVTVVTQNVDDLHERAGTPDLVKLHGSLFANRCSRCTYAAPGGAVDATSEATLPRCPLCASLLRPGVVWFGEALPEDRMAAALRAARLAEACLVVGTAGAVYPAAGIVHAAHDAGAAVIVVDPGETAYDGIAAVRLAGAAGEILPGLLAGER